MAEHDPHLLQVDAAPASGPCHAEGAWLVVRHVRADGSLTGHTVPEHDLIEHDLDAEGDCICGPAMDLLREHPVFDGEDGWWYVHNSLDGRELNGGTA
jgi:hypothetical protein